MIYEYGTSCHDLKLLFEFAVLKVAPLAKSAILLVVKDFAFLGSKILAQLGILEQLLQSMSEFAPILVGTNFIL